jgi:hypothetical protein
MDCLRFFSYIDNYLEKTFLKVHFVTTGTFVFLKFCVIFFYV